MVRPISKFVSNLVFVVLARKGSACTGMLFFELNFASTDHLSYAP